MKKTKAIILAAGMGNRMVPINQRVPKAFLKVNGVTLIERLIGQLNKQGITDIYIVVGYMKEHFEELKKKYDVHLINNPHYFDRNNLYSLYLTQHLLKDCFVVPCDVYFHTNPFHHQAADSWYGLVKKPHPTYPVSINQDHVIRKDSKGEFSLVGLAYMNDVDGLALRERLERIDDDYIFRHAYWEDILFHNQTFELKGRVVDAFEINTYEDLRRLDNTSEHLKDEAIAIIASVLQVPEQEIKHIECLKQGMTNRSFLFDVYDTRYCMRIPGEGTNQLLNRKQEYDVYQAIKHLKISDEVVYFDQVHGYKLSKYIKNARVCEAYQIEDVTRCMDLLRSFHQANIQVDYNFDLFETIEYYETLRGSRKSLYRDYFETKEKMYRLKAIVDSMDKQYTLTHIDAICDNFLFHQDGVSLIDWEYASMQDPDVDLAMFCIYAMYSRKMVDTLIDIYYKGQCPKEKRIKIYCYVAICGFLWSNWCEYKHTLGVDFGIYALKQYTYAKDYYKLVMDMIGGKDHASC